jgi:hypothetical protein
VGVGERGVGAAGVGVPLHAHIFAGQLGGLKLQLVWHQESGAISWLIEWQVLVSGKLLLLVADPATMQAHMQMNEELPLECIVVPSLSCLVPADLETYLRGYALRSCFGAAGLPAPCKALWRCLVNRPGSRRALKTNGQAAP